MPPALWRSFPLCFIRYGFSRAPGVFQLRNSPGSKQRSVRGDFAKGCLLPSRTPALRPQTRTRPRPSPPQPERLCAVTSLLRPTAVTGRPGPDAAPRALSPGAAPLCAVARSRRSESPAGARERRDALRLSAAPTSSLRGGHSTRAHPGGPSLLAAFWAPRQPQQGWSSLLPLLPPWELRWSLEDGGIRVFLHSLRPRDPALED